MTKKIVPQRKLQPELIDGTVDIHADVLASFKATVSKYNKNNPTKKIAFDYGKFDGSFCKATPKTHPDILTRIS